MRPMNAAAVLLVVGIISTCLAPTTPGGAPADSWQLSLGWAALVAATACFLLGLRDNNQRRGTE